MLPLYSEEKEKKEGAITVRDTSKSVIAIATNSPMILLYDVVTNKRIEKIKGHSGSVEYLCSLAKKTLRLVLKIKQ